jgi:hypothetical protein
LSLLMKRNFLYDFSFILFGEKGEVVDGVYKQIHLSAVTHGSPGHLMCVCVCVCV